MPSLLQALRNLRLFFPTWLTACQMCTAALINFFLHGLLIFRDWYACALLSRDDRWEVVLDGKARVWSENTKMAGKCLFRITSEWFLDYCIYQLWKEFRDTCSFSDCWKNRIQGKEELKLKSKRFWAAVFNTKVRKFGLSLIWLKFVKFLSLRFGSPAYPSCV